MDYADLVLNSLLTLIIVVVFTKLIMGVANYIGKEFSVGDFILSLWRKISRLIINKND